MSLLSLNHVSKFYSDGKTSSKGIDDVSLSFDRGEFIAITGESGSGKTTLLNVITLMDSYDEGELLFNGKSTADFTDNDMLEFRKKYVSFVFQDYNLIQSLSALDNLVVALKNQGYNHKEAIRIAKEKLYECGLKDRIREKVTRLSGGERQRVVIARALAINSPIIAFDEPTGNLDSTTGKDIIALINKIKTNRLIFFITHDYSAIEPIATRHIVMKDGKVDSDTILKDKYLDPEHPLIERDSKTSFKAVIYSAFKLLFLSPKKLILLAMTMILFALSAFFASMGTAAIAESLESNYKSSRNENYFFENTAPNTLYYIKDDKDIPDSITEDKDAIYDTSYINLLTLYTTFANPYFERYSSNGYSTASDLTVYLPEEAELIAGDNDDSISRYYVILNYDTLDNNIISAIKKDYNADFNNSSFSTLGLTMAMSSDDHNNYSPSIRYQNLSEAEDNFLPFLRSLPLNGIAAMHLGYDAKNVTIALNKKAYEFIKAPYDKLIRDCTKYYASEYYVSLDESFIEHIFGTYSDATYISYRIADETCDFKNSFYYSSDKSLIYLPSNLKENSSAITLNILGKDYSIDEYIAFWNEYSGLDLTLDDIFLDACTTPSYNCLYYKYGEMTVYSPAIIPFAKNASKFAWSYHKSKKIRDEVYDKIKDDYYVYKTDATYESDVISFDKFISAGAVILNVFEIIAILLALLLAAWVLSVIVSAILKKYNPDLGVYSTLGFSNKFIYAIRLLIVEIPLVITYIIVTAVMLSIYSTKEVFFFNSTILPHLYVFFLFGIFAILLGWFMVHEFYLKQRKKNMQTILKEAGGK